MKQYNYNQVNIILAEWDPIGVGYPINKFEYTGYIPKIVSGYENDSLFDTLKKMVEDDMGIDDFNESSLQEYCIKIAEILEQ